MTLPTISPADARQLFDKGASLVDIREADEHAREKILGAHNLPLSKLDESDLALQQGKPVIFHCGSGARTLAHAPRLVRKRRPAKPSCATAGSTPGSAQGSPSRPIGDHGGPRAATEGNARWTTTIPPMRTEAILAASRIPSLWRSPAR